MPPDKTSKKDFFSEGEVEKYRNFGLKTRLRTLIFKRGMKESDFYRSIGLGKDYWWRLSWGLMEPSLALKIRIATALETDSSLIWQRGEELQK